MLPASGLKIGPSAGPRAACDNTHMSKATPSTKVSENGLRYAAKVSGSPFTGTGHTRSCFLCGRHRQAAQLKSKRVLGRAEMVCAPSCNSVE
jgi:hypothetical protein